VPAFRSVHKDISGSYTAYYYPQNSGPGFRRIEVKFAPPGAQNWHVRARAGYRARAGMSEPDSEPKDR
jgi:hypothetical protein